MPASSTLERPREYRVTPSGVGATTLSVWVPMAAKIALARIARERSITEDKTVTMSDLLKEALSQSFGIDCTEGN